MPFITVLDSMNELVVINTAFIVTIDKQPGRGRSVITLDHAYPNGEAYEVITQQTVAELFNAVRDAEAG